jgi:mono/diheme cytochrome c family protein
MRRQCFLLALALFTCMDVFSAPPVEEGRLIFANRCAACHSVNKVLTGPALAGVDKRRSMDWIVSFVQSSQSMVKKGDQDAVALFEKFNKVPMPDHRDLTGSDIASIVEYIKSSEVATTTEAAPFRKPGKLRPAYMPLSIQRHYSFFIAFGFSVVLLIGGLLFLVNVKELQRKGSNEYK